MVKTTDTLKLLFVINSLMISLVGYAASDIEQRIKPIGQVQVKGDESSTIPVLKKLSPAKDMGLTKEIPGADTYNKHCKLCHAKGLAGAPKFKDENDWKLRQTKGLDILISTAKNGLNAMPPKGTCMSCTDEQLKDAINYMLPSKVEK